MRVVCVRACCVRACCVRVACVLCACCVRVVCVRACCVCIVPVISGQLMHGCGRKMYTKKQHEIDLNVILALITTQSLLCNIIIFVYNSSEVTIKY